MGSGRRMWFILLRGDLYFGSGTKKGVGEKVPHRYEEDARRVSILGDDIPRMTCSNNNEDHVVALCTIAEPQADVSSSVVAVIWRVSAYV